MSESNPPPSKFPASMGPGARSMQPGESPGSLIKEMSDIRSSYSIHVDNTALNLSYRIQEQQRHYRLLFDNIPLQGLSRSMLYSGEKRATVSGIFLIDLIRAAENMSGRTVTQQEAESIAFYTSKSTMTVLWGQIIAIGIGYTVAWNGRRDMKFPFMKPKPAERYANFPNRYVPLLKGYWARSMWQITRANVYAALSILFLSPFARSMANSSMVVGLYRDSRTHDLMKSMKGVLDRFQSNRSQAGVPRIPQQNQDETIGAMDSVDSQTFFGGNSGDNYSNYQDYSSDTTFTDDSIDTGVMSDRATQQRQSTQPTPKVWGKPGSRSTSHSQTEPRSSSSDVFFNDDDASPTAGNDPNIATPSPYNSQSSGSAWDRIRRGRQTRTQNSSQQQSSNTGAWKPSTNQDADTSAESFSFSRGSEDRQLAKEQAQKEFDALLERERREGGNAEYTRDMQATQAGMESTENTGSAWRRRRRG